MPCACCPRSLWDAHLHRSCCCLDVVMPGLDGVELTAKLKATPSTADIPILIVSASAQRRDFELAQGAGADGYLTKPFAPDDLLAEVERLISMRRV